MPRPFIAFCLSILISNTLACGKTSQAELDCEEFNRFANYVHDQVRADSDEEAATTMPPEVCTDWIESASTRCQQVFYDLAACSRSHDSAPDIPRGECLSAFFEVAGACVLPQDVDP